MAKLTRASVKRLNDLARQAQEAINPKVLKGIEGQTYIVYLDLKTENIVMVDANDNIICTEPID